MHVVFSTSSFTNSHFELPLPTELPPAQPSVFFAFALLLRACFLFTLVRVSVVLILFGTSRLSGLLFLIILFLKDKNSISLAL